MRNGAAVDSSRGGTEIVHIDLKRIDERARRSLSAMPRAFLRWAGSKRALLPQLLEVLPPCYRTYREPFLGSGALFFLLQPSSAVLSDSCQELIETYEAVRDHPTRLLNYLEPLRPDKSAFYEMRGSRSTARVKRAAEFIYLNKTCWNGLYRVNAKGEFNVPYGAPKSDTIIDRSNLRACSTALNHSGVELMAQDFDEALYQVRAGDLVFLDPPYVTGHNNNGFIDYNELIFSWEDQERAARAAQEAASAGAHVIVTNALHDDVVALYGGFKVRELQRQSTLAASANARRPVKEAIMWKPGILSD
jgi:DNA adenine methylase